MNHKQEFQWRVVFWIRVNMRYNDKFVSTMQILESAMALMEWLEFPLKSHFACILDLHAKIIIVA